MIFKIMKKVKKKYVCKHCRKLWDEWYLADLCFLTDMNNLQKNDKLNLSDNELQKQSGTK